MTADAVVVGAGLAGATAALALGASRRVVLVESEAPAAGASGAAAGLVNPFMGRKAKPAWRRAEALEALDELAESVGGGFRRTGVVRPATSESQSETFRERAKAHDGLDWLDAGASSERWPNVTAPHGSLWVSEGGSVDVAAFVRAIVAEVKGCGAETATARLGGWRTEAGGVVAETSGGTIHCRHLVLAPGDGVRCLPDLSGLPLHRVKGQTVTLARPPALPADHPAVAGTGYVVPSTNGVVVGATFEHHFTSTEADPARDAELVAKGVGLVPSLAGAAVTGRRAGVRLTVPTAVSPRRLPLAGPLPGHPGVWVVAGLGAKGLLTAPLVARRLPDALDGRQPLPAELALDG